jgi:hypothetical protein
MANEITSANVAQAIVKVIASEVLPAVVGNLTMAQLVNRSYDPEIATAGDVVNVPIAPAMTAGNLAEGGSVTNQNPNLGNAQLSLATHGYATFTIPDVTKVLAQPDLMKAFMQPAVVALAEKIEGDLLGLYPQFTANASVGTANTAITEAVLDSAELALFNAKVPPSDPRYLLVNGATHSTIRQISRFTELQTIGSGDSIVTGDIMKVKNLNVIRSQYVKKVSTTTNNIAFTRDAIGLVFKRLPQPLPGTGAIAEYIEYGGYGFRVVMSYQPGVLAQQFTIDCLYGCGVLRNPFGVLVLS